MKVFVTGGHGGIGSAVCEKFAREGYEVVAPGSKELDLSDLAAVKNYFAARDGRFDAVVHCAGYNPPLSVEDTTIEEFDRTQNINLTSLLEITRAVAPYMKEQKTRPHRRHRLALRHHLAGKPGFLRLFQTRAGRTDQDAGT